MDSITTMVLQDATLNTWFYPNRDRHYLLKPFQMNGFTGTRSSLSNGFKTYTTPDNVERYILYTFSGLSPAVYGLELAFWEWASISELGNEQDVSIIAVMNNRMLQLDGIKFQYTPDNELVIAVPATNYVQLFYSKASASDGGTQVGALLPPQSSSTVADGGVSLYPELLLRFYSNEWFTTELGTTLSGIHTKSVICKTANDAQGLVGNYNATGYRSKGTTQWYLDGYLVDEPTPSLLKDSEVLQYRHDSSGIGYFDLRVENLDFYNSSIDKKDKYIIVPPPHVTPESLYWDDVEIYVCGITLPEDNPVVEMKGFFFSKEQDHDITQLTHKDFSISAEKVMSIISEQAALGVIDIDNAFIRVYYRHSTGYQRARLDSSYLLDLNDLPYHLRYTALTSANSPSIWNADVLESSAYMNWATATAGEIKDSNYKLIEETLSYAGYQEMMTDTYEKAPGVWTIPKLAMAEGTTVVELDTDGTLLNQRYLTLLDLGSTYAVSDALCKKVIFYPGTAFSNNWGEAYKTDTPIATKPSPFISYRYLRANTLSPWVKAVNGTHYEYNKTTDKVSWISTYQTYILAIRNAGKHLVREMSISRADFPLPITPITAGGKDYTSTGFGRWDIWLNKRKLVQGVGFVVKDQLIYLCDKEFWASNDNAANLLIIGYGLPGDTVYGTSGFVINECINYNEQFDLLKHRGTRLYIEGDKKEISDVYLAETYMGDDVFTFTDDLVYDYIEGIEYEVGQVAMYLNRVPLVCTKAITATTDLDESAWGTLTSVSTYKMSGSDTYVKLVPFGTKVKMLRTYSNGVELVDQPLEALSLTVSYSKVLGNPLANPVNNGSLYEAYGAPSLATDLTPMKFSDTPAEFRLMTKNIGAWLSTQLPALPVTDSIVINNQHRVVSIYMQMIFAELVKGTIDPPNLKMSKSAISAMLAHLEEFRLIDPALPGKLDKRFVMFYPHVGEASIGLPARHVNFLYSVNEYFMDNQVNMNLNIHIS